MSITLHAYLNSSVTITPCIVTNTHINFIL